MLDLNEVRMFVQVVRAHSFAEAARRLSVPPNTLSRRIRQLETTLDTRLMQRSTRKLTLTAAGHLFFERCASAVDGVIDAGRELAHASHDPAGTVRVAAPADFLDLFKIEWVGEFLAAHPRVHLDFVLNDALADLIEEKIDVAFRGGVTRDAQTVYRQLGAQYSTLVASPAYLELRGRPAALGELVEHDCLTSSGNRQGPVMWSLKGPQGVEEVRVSGRLSANSARALIKGCVSAFGIALLPTMLILSELRSGNLVRVLPEYRRDGANMNVLLPSRLQIPSAVTAFVDFVAGKFQFMPADFNAAVSGRRERKTAARRVPRAF